VGKKNRSLASGEGDAAAGYVKTENQRSTAQTIKKQLDETPHHFQHNYA
jgi:hypothetical protein